MSTLFFVFFEIFILPLFSTICCVSQICFPQNATAQNKAARKKKQYCSRILQKLFYMLRFRFPHNLLYRPFTNGRNVLYLSCVIFPRGHRTALACRFCVLRFIAFRTARVPGKSPAGLSHNPAFRAPIYNSISHGGRNYNAYSYTSRSSGH